MLATDIKDVRADNRKLKLSTAIELGYQGITINVGKATRPRNRSPRTPRCARRSSSSLDREAINQVVFNGEFMPGNQWVSPEQPLLSEDLPGSASATSPRPRRC